MSPEILAQSRKAAKPQSRKAAKPQSRKAAGIVGATPKWWTARPAGAGPQAPIAGLARRSGPGEPIMIWSTWPSDGQVDQERDSVKRRMPFFGGALLDVMPLDGH